MPGGRDVALANVFRGINRMLSPTLLPENESPDCQDCAPYGDLQGLLGPRPGRRKVANRSYDVIGGGSANFPYGRYRILATNDGTWSPIAVPWPALIPIPVPTTGCEGCSIFGSGAYGTALGSVFMAVALNGVAVSPVKGVFVRQTPVFAGIPGAGVGWVGPDVSGPESPRQFKDIYTDVTTMYADVNGLSAVGFADFLLAIGPNAEIGYWDGASATAVADFNAIIIPMTGSITVNGTPVALGESHSISSVTPYTLNMV